MIILLSLDILEIGFDFENYIKNKSVFDMMYNSNNSFCFTKNYIEFIEKSISDKDVFGSYIKELYDSDRIKIEKTIAKNSHLEEFIEISNTSLTGSLISIVYEDKSNLISKITFLSILKNAKEVNRHWIVKELVTKNSCNVSYQNFKNNEEIKAFFEDLFSINRFISEVVIFDRELTPTYLSKLKSKNIRYYTISSKGKAYELKESKKEIIKELGGKLKLFYTSNRRNIHERKILLNELIITFDNSRNNLITEEPTWEILVNNNNDKSNKWQAKCKNFVEVR